MASIIPHWKGISREFRDYRRDLRNNGYDLDLTFLMRALTVIACDVPKIEKLSDKISQSGMSKKELNRLWHNAKSSMDLVIRTLRTVLLLDRSQFFVSRNALIPLVYYAAKSPKRLDRKAMMKYFLFSQLGRHYGAAVEKVLRKDLRKLSEPNAPVKKGLHSLLEVAVGEARKVYRGSRKIKPEHITGTSSKNVMVLLMYIVMRKRKATDFGVRNPKPFDQIEVSKLQLHHIFPVDFMMKDEKAIAYMKESYGELPLWMYKDDVDDIANITFLSGERNIIIGNTSPWQYLQNETSKEIRRAHFIPEDRDLWKPENFDDFVNERRNMLARAINSLIESLS